RRAARILSRHDHWDFPHANGRQPPGSWSRDSYREGWEKIVPAPRAQEIYPNDSHTRIWDKENSSRQLPQGSPTSKCLTLLGDESLPTLARRLPPRLPLSDT